MNITIAMRQRIRELRSTAKPRSERSLIRGRKGGENECDIVFGIYEGTDHNGHGTGFGNDNYKYIKGFRDQDAMCYELLQAIYSRPSYDSEDWLIIIVTDHGGIQTWHGGQTLEERSTWVVCNKGIDEKYFGVGYDGERENG